MDINDIGKLIGITTLSALGIIGLVWLVLFLIKVAITRWIFEIKEIVGLLRDIEYNTKHLLSEAQKYK